jgi:putative transcriptional regulator
MNRIGEVLRSKGLKQKWLSEQSGVSTVMICSYVKNRRQPKISTLLKIASILKVDVNELLDINAQSNQTH